MIEERLHRYARPDELFCLNESIVSDPVISLHTHDFIELSYIRKGHAIHVLNGSKISVSAGDLFPRLIWRIFSRSPILQIWSSRQRNSLRFTYFKLQIHSNTILSL